MTQNEQNSSVFHIVFLQLSKQRFGKSPFSGVAWCATSARSRGKWTLREAQEEARGLWDHPHPKVVPDTDKVSKHIFLLFAGNFIETDFWKTFLALTVHNFLTQFLFIEIVPIVLQWQLGWKESILQQFLSLHSGDNCNLFPAYYSLDLVLACNFFSLTLKSAGTVCHDWTMWEPWIYLAQNLQDNVINSGVKWVLW